MNAEWTLEELTELSQNYLDDHGPSRRIQWQPNARQIRYYCTLGLLDKPRTERGRQVRYGEKHLMQLLAIKKLQQAGMSLAEIQPVLAGATERELRKLIGWSHREGTPAPIPSPPPRQETPFWMERPTAPAVEAAFEPLWRLELAPGVHLHLEGPTASRLGEKERQLLAQTMSQAWKSFHHTKVKEQT